jgi:hypothetical protein
VKYLEGRIKRMRNLCRTYKVEMRILEKDQRKQFEQVRVRPVFALIANRALRVRVRLV